MSDLVRNPEDRFSHVMANIRSWKMALLFSSYNGFPDLKQDLFQQSPKKASLAVPRKEQNCPNSPVARRTKQEVRTSQKLAQQHHTSPMMWAKCLLGHTYSLWFMILPAYIKHNQQVLKSLNTAYDVLKNMQRAKLKLPDEVCFVTQKDFRHLKYCLNHSEIRTNWLYSEKCLQKIVAVAIK